ncbi:hypothetical protein KY313_00515 [Candidatus Woesearchaeota archaeon]|jgi:hypothetical protein|nr:hypothetical protein [Candidatus Woesearchaeota archaeon]
MNYRYLGKKWERESRTFLEEKFNTKLIFKLINPEQMDWIVFLDEQKIAIVESKSTKKPHYYPFENKKRRNQLDRYLAIRADLIEKDFDCSFYLLLKKGKEVIFQKISKKEDIKRRY